MVDSASGEKKMQEQEEGRVLPAIPKLRDKLDGNYAGLYARQTRGFCGN